MTKIDPAAVRNLITRAAGAHPTSLAKLLALHFGVSRAAANSALSRLVQEGWLTRSGGRTRPTYHLGAKRQVVEAYKIPGINEDQAWLRDFAPYMQLSENITQLCFHGFTEMLNNANDHSGGSRATVLVRQDENQVQMMVLDDGVGVFKKISDALNLPDRRLALLELSKGKLTTDPERHSGEGIFFTSKMFDSFSLMANDLRYEHNSGPQLDWLQEIDESIGGTGVYMQIRLDSTRTVKQVFDDFVDSEEDFEFDKTIVPVRLARLGNENLVSRSQAKRLMVRFDRFRRVVLDFQDVPDIGQAFADELFRVFANSHPQVLLVPINVAPSVAQMIHRVSAAAAGK